MSDIKFPSGCKMLPVDDLVPFAKNPKVHEDKDIDLIIRSVGRNGWGDPILVCPETMEVLSGNGRLLAAKKIGLKEVPVACTGLSCSTAEGRLCRCRRRYVLYRSGCMGSRKRHCDGIFRYGICTG